MALVEILLCSQQGRGVRPYTEGDETAERQISDLPQEVNPLDKD